jgi:hypothetical protein
MAAIVEQDGRGLRDDRSVSVTECALTRAACVATIQGKLAVGEEKFAEVMRQLAFNTKLLYFFGAGMLGLISLVIGLYAKLPK